MGAIFDKILTRRTTSVLLLLGIVLLVLLFTIPYLFPPSNLASSMSYDYGFNNRVGLIIVLIGIISFGIIGFCRAGEDIKIFDTKASGILLTDYLFSIFILGVFLLVIGITNGDRLIAYGGECTYFLPHIEDMVSGKLPYKDFIFYYGPALIYIPYWIHCLLPGTSVVFSYLLTLFIFQTIGLYCLYYIVRNFNVDSKYKRVIFFIVYFASFPTALGLNYELLRFVLPFWLLLSLSKTSKGLSFIWYPLSVIICLAISPEVGLTFLVAVVVYLLLKWVINKDAHYLLLLLSTVLLAVAFMVIYHDMFSMLTSTASGLLNFPFIVSIHLIAFFISLFVLGFYLGVKIRSLNDNVLDSSFIILSLGLIPACLGRCDPGHVTYFGLFVFILCFVFISSKKKFVWLPLLIGIVISIFIQVWNVRAYSGRYINNYLIGRDINIETEVESGELSIFDFSEEDIAMPLINKGEMIDLYTKLVKENKYANLYITRMAYSATPDNINRTVNDIEMKKPTYLLFGRNWEDIIKPSDYSWVIKNVFYSYSDRIPTRNSNIVYLPLLEYVKDQYFVFKIDDNYVLYKKKY